MAIRELLLGAWRLVEWKVSCDGVYEDPSWGAVEDHDGILIYHPSGFVSATLSRRNRPRFEKDLLDGGTDAEKSRAFDYFLSYCGKFEVDEQSAIVHHHVMLCSFPNYVGKDLTRPCRVDSELLELRFPDIQFENQAVGGYIKWARA
jgi:hypothetical protein